MADVSLLFNILARDNTAAGINSASSRMDKFKSITGRAAVGIMAAGAAMGTAAVKSAADQSSAIAAWTQVTGVQMDKRQQTIARSLNLSQTDYAKSYTTLSALYQSNGIEQKKANEMAAAGLKTAADQAAFGNTTVGEAVQAQAGLLKGSGELLEKYSISITAADVAARMKADGTDKLTGAEGKAATAMARSALVTEQSAKFLGQAARESSSLESRQQALAATVEDMKAKIGTALLPVVETFLGKLQSMATWVENNQTKAKLLAAVIGTLAGVVVGAAVVIKAVAAAQKVARAATMIWTGAMWLLNAAFLGNPIGLIVIAIAGLVAAIVICYRKFDWFRFGVNAVIKAVANAWIFMIDLMLGGMSKLMGAMGRLPGPLGAPFRAAGKAIDAARGQLDQLKAKIDGLPTSAEIRFTADVGSALGNIAMLQRAKDNLGVSAAGVDVTSSGGRVMGRYGGMRAAGGPVVRGLSYMVGEEGPELLTMQGDGYVTPHSALVNPRGRQTGGGVGVVGGGTTVTHVHVFRVEGDSADPFVQWLRKQVRTIGNGSVQQAFGVKGAT